MMNGFGRRLPRMLLSSRRAYSTSVGDIFNPTPDHEALRQMVSNFVVNEVEPQAQEHDRLEKFNMELFKKCGELGLLGITADGEYGGSHMDAVAACIVHEELSKSDPGFCLAYLAHSMLLVNNLNFNGSEEQKSKFLPDICSGAKIGGMCMSEPNSGTDVLAMRTLARADGDEYVLNGSKMWITNGYVNGELGDLYLVYAKTGDLDNTRDVSMFIVEKGMPGFSLGQQINNKCGMRASGTAELVFDNVRVPKANIVGEKGNAVVCMMRNLEIERIVLAAMSVGIAARCMDVMAQYSVDRKAFGKSLSNFGQIQKHLAESYAKYTAGRTYLYKVANEMKLDQAGQRLETDGVKLFCTTMGKEVADSAIQVLGGYGYIGDYHVERLWRDSKLLEIGGGTLESQHKNMTREIVAGR
jgi:isovaleryl-CoA dehydrogenase|eukprot:CAMPEP_0174288414 /NCGR_PEP_ID=MMETSP0809-20121228/20457_1 /TAXON_ID=73025 ORGANISM="Eutreptiella gymnastica-like, Strain CCMP1594" /NCGR_SAMPLE_ID=MMETSP0809 /ASSEMBLY_ACC=CAM_ASM_000658 /LENGTH=412 /DNA_ID=CAMNT_0015385565 /DNA_START=28 /DNA_END=1266 /DNA_ORIENTATION=-